MTSWRVRIWGFGFVLVVVAAIVAPGQTGRAGGLPLITFIGWILAGLTFELVALLTTLRRVPVTRLTSNRPRTQQGRRVATVAGVRGEPNPARLQFQRYLSSQPDFSSTDGRARLPNAKGTALTGRVVLVSFFLGKNGKRWSADEIGRVLASLQRSAQWIETESLRWGAQLEVAVSDTYFEGGDELEEDVEIEVVTEPFQMGLFEAHSIEKNLAAVSRASVKLGFHGVADWVDRIGARIDADRVVWLIHPRFAGRSHAITHEVSLLDEALMAICYAQEADLPSPAKGSLGGDSATYAHEILHLFGATDKYDVGLDAFPEGSVTPRDIMRLEANALARLRVDLLTAAEIGWASGRPSKPEMA